MFISILFFHFPVFLTPLDFLSRSRTDGVLPLNLPSWSRGAECFKSNNRQKSCMRAVHCIQRDGPYCHTFMKDGVTGNGKDLATVVFYRHVEEDDPCEWTLNLAGKSSVRHNCTPATFDWTLMCIPINLRKEEQPHGQLSFLFPMSIARNLSNAPPGLHVIEANIVSFQVCMEIKATLSCCLRASMIPLFLINSGPLKELRFLNGRMILMK